MVRKGGTKGHGEGEEDEDDEKAEMQNEETKMLGQKTSGSRTRPRKGRAGRGVK